MDLSQLSMDDTTTQRIARTTQQGKIVIVVFMAKDKVVKDVKSVKPPRSVAELLKNCLPPQQQGELFDSDGDLCLSEDKCNSGTYYLKILTDSGKRRRKRAEMEGQDSSDESDFRPSKKSNVLSVKDISSLSSALLNAMLPSFNAKQSTVIEKGFKKSSAKPSVLLSPASRKVQGSRLVADSEEAGFIPVDDCVGPLPGKKILQQSATALKNALKAVDKTIANLPKKKVKPETRGQLLLSEFCSRMQAQKLTGRFQVWDTHAKGFTVHNAFGKQKPDMSFAVVHKEPAYLGSLAEAKYDLHSTACLHDCAIQQKERTQALQPYQKKRKKWTFLSTDEASIKIWVWRENSVRATRTLSLSPDVDSEGLQAFVRFLRTSPAELGFVSPELPSQLHCFSNNNIFSTECRISEEPTTRIADVLRGNFSDEDGNEQKAIAKTSETVLAEKSKFEALQKAGLDGVYTPSFLGIATAGPSDIQYILQENAGVALAELDDTKDIMSCILQAAEAIGRLNDKQFVHGDISPYNICKGSDTTKLVDLQTLQATHEQESLSPSGITGTLLFISLAVHDFQPQTSSTDLESLLYVLMWMSLDRALPWREATLKTAADAKRGVMLDNKRFQDLVQTIKIPAMRDACSSIRRLFFENGNYTAEATAEQFVSKMKKAQLLLSPDDPSKSGNSEKAESDLDKGSALPRPTTSNADKGAKKAAATRNVREEEKGEVEKSLEAMGFQIRQVLGDGNCMFRACSYCLKGTEADHGRLRKEIADHIADNSKEFSCFMEDDIDVSAYCKKLRKERFGGGRTELMALSAMQGIQIRIYEEEKKCLTIDPNSDSMDLPEPSKDTPVMRLLYIGGKHYKAVVPD